MSGDEQASWLSRIRETKADPPFRGFVKQGSGDADDESDIEKDSSYLNIFLESMYVGTVRRGFTRVYGTLTSHCSIPTVQGNKIESVVVTTPEHLKKQDRRHLNRVPIDEKRLFGPAPYTGGDLALEVGLFLVPSQNLLEPYLQVVEDIARLAAQPFAAAAAPFIKPAVNALGLLFGDVKKAQLQIGIARSWSQPKAGLYAVAAQSYAAGITFDRQQRRLVDNGKAVDAPHLVLRIERTTERDDWQAIPDLKEAYADFKRAALNNDLAEAEVAVKAFRLRSQFSPDLIASDATRLANKVDAAFHQTFDASPTAAGPAPTVPEFSELDLYDRRATSLP